MQLIIVRHAVAEERDASRWPNDSLRPLTEKGVKQFKRMAGALGLLAPDVARLLSSKFTRAWDTAKLLTEHAGWPEATREPSLEMGSPEEILAAIAALRAGSDQTIALVGHEPTLSELVSLLLSGDIDHMRMDFKKGAAVALEIATIVAPGSAELKWMLTPRMLRGLSTAK